MPISHRPIPLLPERPRPHAISATLTRSYPVGRQAFSRAFCGAPIELTISTKDHFPEQAQVCLSTTVNAARPGEWVSVPFERVGTETFVCRITSDRPGLFTFRARFSLDGGASWLHDSAPDAWVLVDPPQVDHVRLYSMIPTVSGTIADWSLMLEHIQSLGFNTVHLLPITELDASESPYSARDLFSVDHSYLDGFSQESLAQLDAFVERARQMGIQLCFDLVLNHVGVRSAIVQHAPDWIVPDANSPDGLRRARYWSDKGWLPWNDLVLIDYEHPSERVRAEIWNYMTEYALFWGKYANYTNGFVRFDNLHSSDKGFVSSVTRALRSEHPNLGIIAEYFTDAGTLLNTVPGWGLNLILATPWDSRFVPQLREYLKYIHSISEHIRFFMPITSHDSGSPAQEFASAQATIPRYVAAALMGTGATGITQGVEWADKERTNFIGRQKKLARSGEPRFGAFLKTVNDIVANHTVFRRGKNCEFVDNNHHAVIAVTRVDLDPPGSNYLIVCNFDILHAQLFEADLSAMLGGGSADAVDLLTGAKTHFTDARVKLELEPCDAMVLMFQPIRSNG